MKWYFTPDIGSYGAAIEIDENGNACRIALALVAPDGQLAFMKWIPPAAGLCNPVSYQVASMTLYEATEECTQKLKGLFSNVIVQANGNGPRLIR